MNIKDKLNSLEEKAQHDEKRSMSETLDYQLTKGEITPEEHTTQALEIQRQYKEIVRRIYNQ